MKTIATICSFVICHILSYATDFHKLPNSQNVTLSAIIADTDSSVLIVGYEGNPVSRGIIIRADIFGDTIWSKSFEDSLSVQFLSIALSFDSSRIVVVGNREVISGPKDGLIIEMDREGNIQWQKLYSFYLNDHLFEDISFINSKTFAVSSDGTSGVGSLILFDSSGYSFKGIGGGYLDHYAAPILLADGNLFISGVEHSTFDNTSMNFGMKIDTSLTILHWSNVYNGFTTNDAGNAGKKGIALDDGGLIFSNTCLTQFSMRNTTYRIDSSGQVVWSIEGGPYFTEFANGDFLISNGNYYNPTPGFIRMDPNATAFINYNSGDGIASSGLTSLNGKILGISTNGFFGFDSLDCNMTNIGSASDSSYNYPVDPYPYNGSIGFNFITSNSNLHPTSGISFYQDCTPIGVFESTTTSFKIYPNPSEGRINIEFEDDLISLRSVRITDLFGRIHFSETLNANESGDIHQYNFSDFPKGIYLMEIVGASSKTLSKLILK